MTDVEMGGPDGMITLDTRGEKCPLPVLKTEKMLLRLKPGQVLVVLASDPVARIDIPLYCRQNGHALALSEAGGVLRFEITCGDAAGS